MSQPVLSDTAQRLYGQLAPTYFRGDETYGWAGAKFVSGLARMFDPVAAVVQPKGTKPPFAVLFCPTECPAEWLPWVAQFVGIEPVKIEALLQTGQETLAREWIERPLNFIRGTAEGMELAAKGTLTGAKRLFFYVRYNGEAFRIKAASYASETPNPAATREALVSMMAAWCVLEYEAITGGTVATAEAAHPTVATSEAADATVQEAELNPSK